MGATRMFWEENWRTILCSALVFVAALAFVAYQSSNVPTSVGVTVTGEVLDVGVSHTSNLELAYPLASVRLDSGAVVYVEVPSEFVVSKGQRIYVQKAGLKYAGTQYKIRGLEKAQ